MTVIMRISTKEGVRDIPNKETRAIWLLLSRTSANPEASYEDQSTEIHKLEGRLKDHSKKKKKKIPSWNLRSQIEFQDSQGYPEKPCLRRKQFIVGGEERRGRDGGDLKS